MFQLAARMVNLQLLNYDARVFLSSFHRVGELL